MLKKRSSGILLHISSLPSDFGIGDFGPRARKFADFLEKTGIHFWQILPLNMTMSGQGYSPYNCFSAFAGNPLLISPRELVRDGLLKKNELSETPRFSAECVDYDKCAKYKNRLFELAFERFDSGKKPSEYEKFLSQYANWLDDFTLFMALKEKYGHKDWSQWPVSVKNRKPAALTAARKELRKSVEYHLFLQYVFLKQYHTLKRYCNQKGVQIFGDLPIYVTYDSADVWANPEYFKLTRSRKPKFIAGVPPDYFSKTGQLWGNPVYDWQRQAEDGYSWWMRRMAYNFQLFDLLRIDHFRGFEAYWQVPAGHKTAMNGRWVEGPGQEFFRTLMNFYSQPPIVVEDLGEITPAVRELIGRFTFPVMKVLHFAFNGKFVKNTHLPHNHIENAVVYTGTHDNNTTLGWYRKDLPASQRKILTDYLGKKVTQKTIHQEMIRMALGSVARLAVIPMQDVLGLDEKARMNTPSTAKNNWRWRLKPEQLKAGTSRQLRKWIEQYGRL